MLAVIAMEIHLLPDWALLIQLGIFLLAAVVLHFFLFKPTLNLIYRRREFTTDASEEAGRLNAEADHLDARRTGAIARALETAHAERARRVKTVRLEAERIVVDARLEVRWFLDTTEMFIESSEQSIMDEMNSQAERLSEAIISQVVAE